MRMTISNKTILPVALLAMLAFTAPAVAQDIKLGVVKPDRLIDESAQSKVALKKLEAEFSERDKKLINEQKAIRKLEEDLKRDGAVMSEAKRLKLDRDIQSRKRDLRRAADELREDRTFRINEERNKLLLRVNEAIMKVGKEEGFDLILYEGIAFANPAIDLTDRILKRLDGETASGKK